MKTLGKILVWAVNVAWMAPLFWLCQMIAMCARFGDGGGANGYPAYIDYPFWLAPTLLFATLATRSIFSNRR